MHLLFASVRPCQLSPCTSLSHPLLTVTRMSVNYQTFTLCTSVPNFPAGVNKMWISESNFFYAASQNVTLVALNLVRMVLRLEAREEGS